MVSTNVNICMDEDLKRAKRRGYDMAVLTEIIKKLSAGEPLPEKTAITVSRAATAAVGKVTSCRIGC
ncbi:hypothetical protein [Selenomonas sputigena]|uniref:hypothetical protein n=1 Tax=Selenomonas sputigena TaxID=69823 RepID=UPI003F66A12F